MELARRPRRHRRLAALIADDASGAAMVTAYRTHGYTMACIARHVGRHVATVSRRIHAHERAMFDCKI